MQLVSHRSPNLPQIRLIPVFLTIRHMPGKSQIPCHEAGWLLICKMPWVELGQWIPQA